MAPLDIIGTIISVKLLDINSGKVGNLEKFVVLFASLESSHLENFFKHIFKMDVNRKLDFRLN